MYLGPTQRVVVSWTRARLSQAGDVHPNPGPTLEALQLNINGASAPSLAVLGHIAAQHQPPVDLLLLQETRTPAERPASRDMTPSLLLGWPSSPAEAWLSS